MLYGLEKSPKRKRFHSQFMDGFMGTDILEDYPHRRDTSYDNRYPAVNIIEYDKDFEIELAAPGFCKNDYEITIYRDTLRIESKKELPKENDSARFSRREFAPREFQKTFILPENADSESISASCSNGVLLINVPKKVIESRPKTKTISIS